MITRREFLQDGVLVTGGLAAEKLLVEVLTPVTSHAAQVDPNDPGLVSSEIKYPSTDETAISAYLTRPKGNEAHPAVLVIHEWDGIKEHIRDVARRLAKAGYDPAFGARPLRRAIQKNLESPLSMELLGGKFKDGATVQVDVDEKENKIVFQTSEAVKKKSKQHADA